MKTLPQIPVLIVLYLFITNAWAQSDAQLLPETLIERSPFIPDTFRNPDDNTKPVEEPINEGNFEFKGVYSLNGVYYFNLYNKAEQKGYWTTKDEPLQGVQIDSFDERDNRIRVNIGGRSEVYELVKTTDRPMPILTAPRNTPQAAPTNVSAQADQTNAQRRMEALRALARRRAAANRSRIENTNPAAQQQQRVTVELGDGREIQLPPGVPAPPQQVLQNIQRRNSSRNPGGGNNTQNPGSAPSTPNTSVPNNTNTSGNQNSGGTNTNSGNQNSGGPPTFVPGAPPNFTPPSR